MFYQIANIQRQWFPQIQFSYNSVIFVNENENENGEKRKWWKLKLNYKTKK